MEHTSPLLIAFCSVAVLFVLNTGPASVSASSIVVRQGPPGSTCEFPCYPVDAPQIYDVICHNPAAIAVITNCIDDQCAGDELVAANNRFQAGCNTVGVTLTLSLPSSTSSTTTSSLSTSPSTPLTTTPSSTLMDTTTMATTSSNTPIPLSPSSSRPPTSSKSPSSSSTPGPGSPARTSVAPIVGGVVGGGVALIILIFVIIIYRPWPFRKRETLPTTLRTQSPPPQWPSGKGSGPIMQQTPRPDDPVASNREFYPSAGAQRKPVPTISSGHPPSAGHPDNLSEPLPTGMEGQHQVVEAINVPHPNKDSTSRPPPTYEPST